jgi:hypothetical protein
VLLHSSFSQGFANPAKADRRAFQGRLRELLQQGIIEKVNVPRSGKHTGNRTVNCLRLVTSEAQNGSEDNDYPVQSAIVNNDDNTAEGVAGKCSAAPVQEKTPVSSLQYRVKRYKDECDDS